MNSSKDSQSSRHDKPFCVPVDGGLGMPRVTRDVSGTLRSVYRGNEL
jgi:hypothetical protein